MTKALAVILALVVLALGWQSWRMKEASQTIERQGRDLKTTGEKLAKTNSQLIALSILSETTRPTLVLREEVLFSVMIQFLLTGQRAAAHG